MYLCSRNRDLAQLVAHVVRDDEVAGSSPVIPTKQSCRLKIRKPMKFLKDFFYINYHERRALLVILTLLVVSTTMIFIVGSKETMPSEKQQAHNDSIIRHATRQHPGYYEDGLQSSEVFAFDPNTASQSDFQRLGLESWQARNIIKYRNKGGIFSTPRDFARVYGLTKKQFEKLLPFIRIGKDYQPAANFYPRERYNYGYQETAIRTREERKKDTIQYSYPRKLKEGQYININSADTTELQKIPGIGSYYARSIIRYRERLGGFVSMSQIQEVEGVPETALHYMNIDAKHIRKMNVNQLSLAELRKHPYLDFYQAKEIVNYRRTHGPLKSAEELRLLKDFPPAEIERIKPYLAY